MMDMDIEIEKIKKSVELNKPFMREETYSLIEHKSDPTFIYAADLMRNAKTKKELFSAYNIYYHICKSCSYDDEIILCGVLMNTDQNEKFGLTDDDIVKFYRSYKYLHTKSETSAETTPIVDTTAEVIDAPEVAAAGKQLSKKDKSRVEKYINGIKKNIDNINNNAVENRDSIINKTKENIDRTINTIASFDPEVLSQEDIDILNAYNADLLKYKKGLDTLDTSTSDENDATRKAIRVEQPSKAAHIDGGFNVGNFVRTNQPKQPVFPKAVNLNQHPQGCTCGACNTQIVKEFASPHQMGVSNDEMIDAINKHIKFIKGYQAKVYSFYDLIQDKTLRNRLKELDSKFTRNNPLFTQVDITQYADPEDLQKYDVCFTVPCNNKKFQIVVLFNTSPVLNTATGKLSYMYSANKVAK